MSMQRAMTAVFKGPEAKKLDVFDHEFNVKKATITRNGKTRTAVGQISHHLSFRPDDQVYYTIVKQGDVIKSVEKKVSRGGAAPIVAPAVTAASAYLGKPVPPEQVEQVGRALGKFAEGDWETVADVILGNIAVRL